MSQEDFIFQMAKLREFQSVQQCLVWDHTEEFTLLKKCCRYDTPPPHQPTQRVRRPLCIEFWLREGRLKSFYSITVTTLLNFAQPAGDIKTVFVREVSVLGTGSRKNIGSGNCVIVCYS